MSPLILSPLNPVDFDSARGEPREALAHKESRSPRWSANRCVAVLVAGLSLPSLGCRRPPPAGGVFAQLEGGAAEIAFSLDQKAVVSRTHGHPDSMFPVLGQNRCEYDGNVLFAGRSVPLKLLGEIPVAVVALEARTYVIVQECFQPWQFGFLLVLPEGGVVRVPASALEDSLLTARFVDPDRDYYFKTWVLKQVLQGSDRLRAVRLFNKSIEQNPRTFFRDSYMQSSDIEWGDILLHFVVPDQIVGFYDGLCTMASASLPNDFAQQLDVTLYAIRHLDSVRGNAFCRDFESTIKAKRLPSDHRLQAIAESRLRDKWPVPTREHATASQPSKP